MNNIELIVDITWEVEKALNELEQNTCGATTVLIERPWSIPVVCNLIKGHSREIHTNGLAEWSD